MKTKTHGKKLIYRGKHYYTTNLYGMWIQKGKEKYWKTYAMVKAGVAVIPLTEKNKIVMIREYKVLVKDYIWQIPTGYIEKNSSLTQNAKKELEEETGYTATNFKKLFNFYPSMGSLIQKFTIVLAKNAVKTKKAKPEKREDIGIAKEFTIKEAVKMVEKGKIFHDSTIMGIYYLASKLRRR